MIKSLTKDIKKLLTEFGADIVGIGKIDEIEANTRKDMPYGICIAVAIPKEVVNDLRVAPSMNYFDTYHLINDKLDKLSTLGAEFLMSQGFKAYPQTNAAVKEYATEFSTQLPHKTVATRCGIGWIGKCALLITEEYGSAIRITSILTDAPLEADTPNNESKCGNCMLCTNACPAQAVKGINWNINLVREEFFDPVKCKRKAREISKEMLDKEITLCGKCINVCPYTQAYLKRTKI